MLRRPSVTHVTAPEYLTRTRPTPGVMATLDALEVLAQTDRPMTYTEVARTLEASPATVHRVLAILVERGYVWRNRWTGRFALALRLFCLAHARDPVSRVVAAIDGHIQPLSTELEHIVYAAMLGEDRLVPIMAAHPPGAAGFRVEVGRPVPALHSGAGCLLLAHARPNTLPRSLARSREFTWFRTKERVALAVAIPEARAADEDHAPALETLRAWGDPIAQDLGLTAPSRARPPDR